MQIHFTGISGGKDFEEEMIPYDSMGPDLNLNEMILSPVKVEIILTNWKCRSETVAKNDLEARNVRKKNVKTKKSERERVPVPPQIIS